MNVTAIYAGLPVDMVVPQRATQQEDVWEKHKGVFITIIILALLCLIIIIVGLLCIRCRNTRGTWSRAPSGVSEKLYCASIITQPSRLL